MSQANVKLQTEDSLTPKALEAKRSGASLKKMGIGLGIGAVLVGGGTFAYQSYLYVSTDNAMVQAQTTLLSAKVAGIIVKADVEENQKVKGGQVLVEIQTNDYKNRFESLQSEADSIEAQYNEAKTNYLRTIQLHKQGASTQERLDAAQAQFRSLEAKFKSAKSQVTEAQQNLDDTKIVAPSDGKLGKKSFEVGMLASPGQPLLGFVAGNERWVVANLKETDMANITEGKKAYISVDAIPGKTFEGVIDSISPTTGATFSLLPPDNATGNFTKVVQHIPVRIKMLDLTQQDADRLQAGLSADVKIRVH